MGLRMDSIHTPTVPSGPTSRTQPRDAGLNGKSLTDLISLRDDMEAELKALGSVLDSHHVDMNTSLTTFDGYPRHDIDIAQVRTTRTRIIHLKNDYKEVMKRIELGLHEHHAALRLQNPTDLSLSNPVNNAVQGYAGDSVALRSFAKVNSVADGSPAATSGLRSGDEIRGFGDIDWTTHESLKKIAETVQYNEGTPILVKVLRINDRDRTSRDLRLQLTPRRGWGGRGLLGCHLLPL